MKNKRENCCSATNEYEEGLPYYEFGNEPTNTASSKHGLGRVYYIAENVRNLWRLSSKHTVKQAKK